MSSFFVQKQSQGPGCCNLDPEDCDWYIYTYESNCSGKCPVNEECKAIQTDLKLIYEYINCSGSCPDDCTVSDHDTQSEQMPVQCDCEGIEV